MKRREFLGASTAAGLAARSLAAEQVKPVRVGIVGVGGRGTVLLRILLELPGVEVVALADIDDNAVARAQQTVMEKQRPKPQAFAAGPEDYRRLVELKELDAVITATPWPLHAPVMLAAMDAGKYAATEVPACTTIEQCWELLEKQEKTGARGTMLENWVYRREPMAVWGMAQAGLLGEVVHCESGYGHDVRAHKFDLRRDRGGRMGWRAEESIRRNGVLYPTHQFAPVAHLMDINHSSRIEYLVAMASPSLGMNKLAVDRWGTGHPCAKQQYLNGDRSTALLKLNDGRTAINFHDTQSWHPRDDGHKYLGTKGMVRWPFPDPGSAWFQDRHWDGKSSHANRWHPLDPFLDEFDHPLWKKYRRISEEGLTQIGHGGGDWLVVEGFVESVRHRTDPPIPLVDALTWSAIGPLSEQSIAEGGKPVAMPDFTRGRWKTNPKFVVRWQW